MQREIRQKGAKTERRLSEHGSERDFFKKIYRNLREKNRHFCVICGLYVTEPKPHNFAHDKPKGMYPELRYDENNVSLVCSIRCHETHDKKLSRGKGSDTLHKPRNDYKRHDKP